jgi:hypothetical protein
MEPTSQQTKGAPGWQTLVATYTLLHCHPLLPSIYSAYRRHSWHTPCVRSFVIGWSGGPTARSLHLKTCCGMSNTKQSYQTSPRLPGSTTHTCTVCADAQQNGCSHLPLNKTPPATCTLKAWRSRHILLAGQSLPCAFSSPQLTNPASNRHHCKPRSAHQCGTLPTAVRGCQTCRVVSVAGQLSVKTC